MSKSYSEWLGKPVVLRVSSRGLNVVLRCTLIGESQGKLRIRIGDGWDVDMYKEMVQNVETDSQALFEETWGADFAQAPCTQRP